MLLTKTKLTAQSFLILTAIASQACLAEQLPTPKQVLQYFNPVHEKSYLNESQDRVIKKKSFKLPKLTDQQAIPNREIGLFANISPEESNNAAFLDALLAREDVNGISCIVPWSELEPVEENYRFSQIDKLLEASQRHGKSLILRISTCGLSRSHPEEQGHASERDSDSDTPAWVFKAGAKSTEYLDADGHKHSMPIFWDTTYLAKWANFVGELGRRYDKNSALHSVGITGGGVLGGTTIVPNFHGKDDGEALTERLKKDFGMSARQLVGHWKYVADIFPKAFPSARMNFDIDPPTPNRSGEDSLDEIVDYLVYRYGERIYLTRQNVSDGKHGFDQYRVLLKFKADTVTGYQLNDKVDDKDLQNIAKTSLDDGISYAEMPATFFDEKDEARAKCLANFRDHVGYQIVLKDATISPRLKAGEPLSASFQFFNCGSATPKRPVRQLDKDVPSSYKIELAFIDRGGKTVAVSRHTPPSPTTAWVSGKPIAWEQSLRLPKLAQGQYTVRLSMVDEVTKHKLNMLDQMDAANPKSDCDLAIGKLEIVE